MIIPIAREGSINLKAASESLGSDLLPRGPSRQWPHETDIRQTSEAV